MKQIAIVIAGAVALFAIALVASFAFTGGDEDGNVHTMSNGRTMTGPGMTETASHTMSGGGTMTGETHGSP